MINKKAFNPFAIGLILFVFLIAFFLLVEEENNLNIGGFSKDDLTDEEIKANKLFFLEDKTLGKLAIISQDYKDVVIGKLEESDIIFSSNSFRLNSNPFTSNEVLLEFDIFDAKNTKEILIYFSEEYITGSNQIIQVSVNDLKTTKTILSSENSPIRVNFDRNLKTIEDVRLKIKLEDVSLFDIFNWNKVDINDLSVVQTKVSDENLDTKFLFDVDLKDVKSSNVKVYLECLEDFSNKIFMYVNDNIFSNINPKCSGEVEEYNLNIPLDYLYDGKNELLINTTSLYKMTFSIQNEYFERKNSNTFNINSFKDLFDIVMYGDFNKQKLNVKINDDVLELDLNEVKSVIQYLNFGVNKITFLDDEIEIYEFSIEKINSPN